MTSDDLWQKTDRNRARQKTIARAVRGPTLSLSPSSPPTTTYNRDRMHGLLRRFSLAPAGDVLSSEISEINQGEEARLKASYDTFLNPLGVELDPALKNQSAGGMTWRKNKAPDKGFTLTLTPEAFMTLAKAYEYDALRILPKLNYGKKWEKINAATPSAAKTAPGLAIT